MRVALALLALLGSTAPAGAIPLFLGLGDLPGERFESEAHAVSADGTVVVGYGTSPAGREAFRWTAATGMVALGDLPGGSFASMGFGVSADGSVIVGRGSAASGPEAFRWTQAGGMLGLGDLPGGAFGSIATDVSADGAVVVGRGNSPFANVDSTQTRAFLWTQGSGLQDLGTLPGGSFSEARGVSADGTTVVGRTNSSSNVEAFFWTQATGMVGSLGGGIAWDASADGSVVVGTGGPAPGFLWTAAGGSSALPVSPRAVSDDGSVVAGRFGNEAYVWDATHGARSIQDLLEGGGLDLTGWTLIEATDVSADGRTFVGFGTSPSSSPGFFEAWVAVVPGPPPAALVLLGLLAAAPRLRRGVRGPGAAGAPLTRRRI